MVAFAFASCAYPRYPPVVMIRSTTTLHNDNCGLILWISAFYAWFIATILIINQDDQWVHDNGINKWFMLGMIGNCICPFIWGVLAFTHAHTTLATEHTEHTHKLLSLKTSLLLIAHRIVVITWLFSVVLIATHIDPYSHSHKIPPILTYIAIIQVTVFTTFMTTLWEFFLIRWTVLTNGIELIPNYL